LDQTARLSPPHPKGRSILDSAGQVNGVSLTIWRDVYHVDDHLESYRLSASVSNQQGEMTTEVPLYTDLLCKLSRSLKEIVPISQPENVTD
jgi:hypothetical protein